MKDLRDILYGVNIQEVVGPTDIAILNVQHDSRLIKKGGLFIAINGLVSDGHAYIENAIELGASAIICEDMPGEINDQVTYVGVKDARLALAIVSENYYDHPSSQLKLVGVTGTNGKTSIATMLFHLSRQLGNKVGLISTIEYRIEDEVISATHTTPDALSIQQLLQQMVEAGCTHCFMEVSSHAVAQHRISALKFAGGVFTNITHDHLDYHETFKDYLNAKKTFFDRLTDDAFSLSNWDDKNGHVMQQNTKASRKGYALRTVCDFKGKILENTFEGLTIQIEGVDIHTLQIGRFNAYNLLAVYGVAQLLGYDRDEVLAIMSALPSPTGRFDSTYFQNEKITGIVDYAHTPDALKNVLQTIQAIRTGNEQLITIIGCGGDRDKAKRPIMASVACEWSDRVILTSDNPRTEDPIEILNDMQKGVDPSSFKKVLVITDRKEAIKTACLLAQQNDIILLAGKGHETYQEIAGERLPFDDKEILTETIKTLS